MSKKRRVKVNKVKIIVALIVIILTISTPFIVSKVSFAMKVSELPDPPKDGLNYEVRGIDVSSYQGQIDWPTLSSQGIAFAFIKATEGSKHVDKYFKQNWEESHKTHLFVGAYHFMSFETSGENQANNFIKNVKAKDDMLPPVIDVEFYGNFLNTNPSRETVHKILTPLIDRLEKKYGKPPILYTNLHVYNKYLDGFYKNDIWISDPTMNQPLPSSKKWLFCQYSFEGVLDGYKGEIKHIDLNVFHGSKSDFVKYYSEQKN